MYHFTECIILLSVSFYWKTSVVDPLCGSFSGRKIRRFTHISNDFQIQKWKIEAFAKTKRDQWSLKIHITLNKIDKNFRRLPMRVWFLKELFFDSREWSGRTRRRSLYCSFIFSQNGCTFLRLPKDAIFVSLSGVKIIWFSSSNLQNE